MKVTITKQHCENADYTNDTDCPLARAIKEQHPEFPLAVVGSSYVWGKDESIYKFGYINWNPLHMEQILNGTLNEVKLNLMYYINDFDFYF